LLSSRRPIIKLICKNDIDLVELALRKGVICNSCKCGKNKATEKQCETCNGLQVHQTRQILEVQVERGMRDGQRIVFSGEAEQAPGTVPGDVVIILDVIPHQLFVRDQNDLTFKCNLDLLTALAGGSFHIKHLNGRTLVVSIPPGQVIKPGSSCYFSFVQLLEYHRESISYFL
jgi:DnaJ family protein A protein 2